MSTEPPGKFFSYTGLRLDPQLHLQSFKYSCIYFYEFLPFIPSVNPFYSQVSPLFQKLEVEQIEALKKRFGGQQVFDVYDS